MQWEKPWRVIEALLIHEWYTSNEFISPVFAGHCTRSWLLSTWENIEHDHIQVSRWSMYIDQLCFALAPHNPVKRNCKDDPNESFLNKSWIYKISAQHYLLSQYTYNIISTRILHHSNIYRRPNWKRCCTSSSWRFRRKHLPIHLHLVKRETKQDLGYGIWMCTILQYLQGRNLQHQDGKRLWKRYLRDFCC